MIGVLLQYVKHYTSDVQTELMIIIRFMKWWSIFFDQKNGDFSATVPAVADMPSPGFNTVLVVRP